MSKISYMHICEIVVACDVLYFSDEISKQKVHIHMCLSVFLLLLSEVINMSTISSS